MESPSQWWATRREATSRHLAAVGSDAAASLIPQPTILSPWQPSPNQLQTIVWADLLELANIPMTRGEAMGVPALAKARHVIAPKVAATPLRKLTWNPQTQTDEEAETPIWVTRTDGDVSPFHRMLWTVDDLIFSGWSLWAVTRGAATDNRPVLTAERVGINRWKFDQDWNVVWLNDKPVDMARHILIPGPHEGILSFGCTAIRHARQLLRNAARASETPTPTFELHQTQGDPMTDDAIDTMVSGWAKARRGENGGVAFTNQSIETKEHGSIDGALLIDGRNAAAIEMARIVGTSGAMVDASTPKASLTYETTQGRGLEHREYGLRMYSDAIAARLSMDDMVPRGSRIRFDITDDLTPQPAPTGPEVED